MFKVVHMINGFYPIHLGSYSNIKEAVESIKEHVRANSAISNPRYSKCWKNNHIRIDYGAKDCYFLIILEE